MEFQGTDRFEILSYLGEGAMGVVYCCRDRERNEEVAVKTLRDLDGEALFRFKNEFRAIQGLRHPNLVSLGELIENEGSWFFTMELIEGQDFLSYVRPRARTFTGNHQEAYADPEFGADPDWKPETTCYVDRLIPALRQLAEGIASLHAAGKVHRDIKPSNVMVARDGRVVILDFGFVTNIEGDTADREIVGTAAYMAPEQATSSKVTPAADWYAVGVILFEALVGRPPVEGSSWEVLMAKQHREPGPPSAYVSGVPAELDALCAALLSIEPKKRPRPEKILKLLGGERMSLRSITASSMSIRGPEFVGRMEELSLLHQAYESTSEGQATAVFVLGESGIGKTALVTRFTKELEMHPDGAPIILIGRCHERESVPYKAFDGVVDALSRFFMTLASEEAEAVLPDSVELLAQIFPVLRRAESIARRVHSEATQIDPAEMRSQVFQAVRELFRCLRQRHRVVVVIDDLQWADRDSLALLNNLLRGPEEPAILLISTVRTMDEHMAPTSPMLVLRRVVERSHEIRLAGLPSDDAARLAGMLLEQLAPSWKDSATGIVAESGGHPLFIDEMIRFVLTSGNSAVESLHLEDALFTRVTALEPAARDVLDHVVVAAVPVHVRTLAAAVKMTTGELGRWVAVLRVANLVRTSTAGGQDMVEIFHDRVRSAVLAHLDRARERHCHERLAIAFEMERTGRPEALAMHWRRAGQPSKSYKYLLLAAEEAEHALAFDRATNLYRQSIELLPAGSADAVKVRARLGDALANAGRAAESANAYLAAARATEDDAVALHARAAGQLLRSGHVDSGLVVLSDVLAGLGMKMPRTPRAALLSLILQRAYVRLRGLRFRQRTEDQVPEQMLARTDIAWSVSIGLGIIDTIRGAEFQARHLRLALETGEPYRVARALAVEAAYRYTAGTSGAKSARRVMTEARALAETLQHPHVFALCDLMDGIGAVLMGHWHHAIELCDSAERVLRAKCHNVSWETNSACIIRMWGQWYTGALSAMDQRMPELLSAARSRGDLYAEATYRGYFLPMLLLAHHRIDEALAQANRGMNRWSQQGFHFQHYFYFFAVTQIDLYRLDYQGAVDRIRKEWPGLTRSMLLQVQQNRIEALHFRARSELGLARAGGEARLLHAAAKRARKIRREATGWGDGLADLILAGVADARADRAGCIQLLERAIAAFDAHDMGLYAAAARHKLGEYLGDSRGHELLARANEWFASEQVARPERMTEMLVSGIRGPRNLLPGD